MNLNDDEFIKELIRIRKMENSNLQMLLRGVYELYELELHFKYEQDTESLVCVKRVFMSTAFRVFSQNFRMFLHNVDLCYLASLVSILVTNYQAAEVGVAISAGLMLLYLQKYKNLNSSYINAMYNLVLFYESYEDQVNQIAELDYPKRTLVEFSSQLYSVLQRLKMELFNKNLQPFYTSHVEFFYDFYMMNQKTTDALISTYSSVIKKIAILIKKEYKEFQKEESLMCLDYFYIMWEAVYRESDVKIVRTDSDSDSELYDMSDMKNYYQKVISFSTAVLLSYYLKEVKHDLNIQIEIDWKYDIICNEVKIEYDVIYIDYNIQIIRHIAIIDSENNELEKYIDYNVVRYYFSRIVSTYAYKNEGFKLYE